jgi:hypothetical protein
MARNENHRETGARKYPAVPGFGHEEFSQDAAGNSPPRHGVGLTQPLDETSEETRQSEGVDPPRHQTLSPSSQKGASAVPEHPDDAKAPRPGRRPGVHAGD